MAQKSPLVLAYDLGGTKVAVGVVDSRGKVLVEVREPVSVEKGKAAVLRQLAEIGQALLEEYPEIRTVGVASAGPLDIQKGILLDPTNFKTKGKTWGKVPIGPYLAKALKRKVIMENDAAAAMLAEHWAGAAKGIDNAIILTLGTGVGNGMVTNGELVRSGRHLHPESSHMVINYDDKSAPCACGNFGDVESYLSGRNFARRAHEVHGLPKGVTAKDVTELARKGNRKALKAFAEFSYIMAIAIQSYIVTFSPEVVIFTGSFAGAHDLFLKPTREHLARMLKRRRVGVDLLPKLVVSHLENQAGLIGGAYVAYRRS